jgi:hypothetical protein
VSGRSQNRDLARLARETARESPEPGRKAWTVVAVALDASASPEAAGDAIADMCTDTGLRIIALACLRELCDDTEQAGTP